MTAEMGCERKLVTGLPGGKKMTTCMHCSQNCCERRPRCSNYSERPSRGTVDTNVRGSLRVKHCKSAVRRTSKRERCVKTLGKKQSYTWKTLEAQKQNPHIHHHCFLCSVDDGPVKISTSGVGAGTQAVTVPGAFAFKPRENRNIGPSYVGITLLFDHLVSHFEFV